MSIYSNITYIWTLCLVKEPHHGLRNLTMQCILARTEIFYQKLSLFCTLALSVSFHPMDHMVLPFLNGFDINCCKCFWEIVFKCVECIIAVIMEVFFDCYFLTAPQKNSIKFNLQWNFGRKMQRCPAASITSWTLDFCSRKSGCCKSSCLAQQLATSMEHLDFLHSGCKPAFHRPCYKTVLSEVDRWAECRM